MVVKKPKNMTNGSICKCQCHKFKKVFTGAFFIALGLIFLLYRLNYLSDAFTGLAWPLLLILLGVVMLMRGCCNCCDK